MTALLAARRPGVVRALTLASVAALIVACGSSSTPTRSATPSDAGSTPPVPVLDSPAPSGSPVPVDSTDASTPPAPTPTPTPRTAVWSSPTAVKGLETCGSIVLAIDDTGTSHLAGVCKSLGQIRYAVSADARSWTVSSFAAPTGRLVQDLQIAFEGRRLSIAYSVVAPVEGSCGDDGLADVGVYVRSRDLPNGDWSSPERIGAVADHLQSFRVSGGTIHATVVNEKDHRTWYETVKAGTAKRYPISGAAGSVALRVGDDGKARIAYESAKGIAFGTFDGAGFGTTTLPSSGRGWDPVLALAPGNVANVLWNRSLHGAGCAEPGPDPDDGTWFASNSGGTWESTRLSDRVGAASITLDPTHGDIHALVDDFQALVHFEKPVGDDWTKETLVTGEVSSGLLRVNPVTGGLVAACVLLQEDADDTVLVMSKR